MWFLQFFFYGMGESKLGNGPSSWILHMAFIILVANMWGLVLKEWKGVNQKTEQFTTEEWDNIPNTVLINLIDSMKHRCELIIEKNGDCIHIK